MINFLHKPCCADGDNAVDISQRMISKINNIKINELEILLPLRLGTKKVPFINMSELQDFPRFTEAEMTEKIFFGSYYIQRSKSYLKDIIDNDFYAIIDEVSLKSLSTSKNSNALSKLSDRMKFSKILGMEILSRHQRSLKTNMNGSNGRKDYRVNYKVFIEYLKDSIECNFLSSYIIYNH